MSLARNVNITTPTVAKLVSATLSSYPLFQNRSGIGSTILSSSNLIIISMMPPASSISYVATSLKVSSISVAKVGNTTPTRNKWTISTRFLNVENRLPKTLDLKKLNMKAKMYDPARTQVAGSEAAIIALFNFVSGIYPPIQYLNSAYF